MSFRGAYEILCETASVYQVASGVMSVTYFLRFLFYSFWAGCTVETTFGTVNMHEVGQNNTCNLAGGTCNALSGERLCW